ncbi:MAG TPA: DUF4215 domain-containing protein, partial [Polyangiales bacterium]|nr:DUF4215 domain-containing protein [Polyangiales bacterium]
SSLKFSPYGKFNLAFKKIAGVPVDIKSFQFGIGLDAQLKLVSTVGLEGQGSVTGELEVFQFAQALAGIEKPKPLEFPIAGGIAGRVYINIGCGLTVKGAMTIKSTLNAGVLAYGGVYWGKNKDGHYTLLPETSLSKNFSSSVDDLEWSADAVLECYLKPKVGLNILHVFETYVEEGPYGTFGVHINKLPYTDFQVGFKGTIGGELGIEDLDLTLAEVSYDLFDYNTTLWTKDFSICGDGYQQLDEQCDIGPFYALHKNVSEPKPAWCGSDCTCAKGFAPRNPVPKDFVGKGAQWGEPDDQGFYTNDCIPSCGNGRIDPGEKCDPRMAPNFSDCGRGCAQDCSHVLGVCGDGILDAQCGETCDDGKVDCSGTCGSSCYMPPLKCGDGITDFNCGETCDDGNTKGNDGCSVTCQASKVCGDGILGTYEECDDGNTDDCDGCNSWCRVEQLTCGDGEVCGNEECDTAGASYSCTAQCKKTRCGDGVVTPESGEQCDDAGESAGCTTDCRLSICGDHYVNHTAGEQCDSGGVDTWSCDADCTLPSCGDNHVNAQREACDDGNT